MWRHIYDDIKNGSWTASQLYLHDVVRLSSLLACSTAACKLFQWDYYINFRKEKLLPSSPTCAGPAALPNTDHKSQITNHKLVIESKQSKHETEVARIEKISLEYYVVRRIITRSHFEYESVDISFWKRQMSLTQHQYPPCSYLRINTHSIPKYQDFRSLISLMQEI